MLVTAVCVLFLLNVFALLEKKHTLTHSVHAVSNRSSLDDKISKVNSQNDNINKDSYYGKNIMEGHHHAHNYCPCGEGYTTDLRACVLKQS